MAGFSVKTNAAQFAAALMRAVKPVEKKVERRIRTMVRLCHFSLLKKTPVWSGRAVRNYIWSKGPGTPFEHEPIESPPEKGPTNSMPLGPEPRRAANEAASTATMEALSFARPWGLYQVTNAASDIRLIEAGAAPSAERSRIPGAMFALTVAEVKAKLGRAAW